MKLAGIATEIRMETKKFIYIQFIMKLAGTYNLYIYLFI